jgi:hypothetical protein
MIEDRVSVLAVSLPNPNSRVNWSLFQYSVTQFHVFQKFKTTTAKSKFKELTHLSLVSKTPPLQASLKFISVGQRDKELIYVKNAKFVLEKVMKAQRGSRSVTLHFL